MPQYKTIVDIIGNTPLVRLQHINPNPLVTIVGKVEFINPSGSIKDRVVHHVIDEAEKKGWLKPGGTIIENTSGNTGAAIAMIAAIRGYKAILTMPDKVSKEKQNALKAFGAKIVVTPSSVSPDSPEHYENVAKRLAQEIPNSFLIDQYDNPKNPEAHYKSTGPEIWEQTKGEVDYFVASGSTGGTITGIGRYLKEKNPKIKVILVDPVGSVYYTYFKTRVMSRGFSREFYLEGIGEDHITKAMDFSLIDEVLQVSDKDAFAMARLLAKREGILAGGSTGANVWGCLEIAKKLDRKATIATVFPDGGIKYLSKIYDDEWMKQHDLL